MNKLWGLSIQLYSIYLVDECVSSRPIVGQSEAKNASWKESDNVRILSGSRPVVQSLVKQKLVSVIPALLCKNYFIVDMTLAYDLSPLL